MRANTCVWGGIYNPIIPVFRRPPKDWIPEVPERMRGTEITRGYINFFEPDVYVETEEGLLEESGLGGLRPNSKFDTMVISLQSFLEPHDGRDWSEPLLGLPITDILRHIYSTEQRFQLRNARKAIVVKPLPSSGLVEAVFGAFPSQPHTTHFAEGYAQVFEPQTMEANPDAWREAFIQGAQIPLRATRYGVEARRYWHHDPIVYIFDPTRPTDLIDLWNLRIEPHPVLPLPIDWLGELCADVQSRIQQIHRPVVGNPHGVMHRATVEFGRSINRERADQLIQIITRGLSPEAVVLKFWRNRIWVEQIDSRIHSEQRLQVTADERRISLSLRTDQETTVNFDTLSPKFATRYGGHNHRWVNAVQFAVYGSQNMATVLPFNIFDRSWPQLRSLNEPVVVGTEGYIFTQKFKGWSETVNVITREDAIIGSLKQMGVEGALSDPGHIAKQMLEHLGGPWATHLLAHRETIQLLNKMAGGLRRKSNDADTVEETFERRTASAKDWIDLVARRQERSLPRLDLSDFTKRNVVRLGLETDCPRCKAANWHSLTAADYELTCERCLNRYSFPQDKIRKGNGNWHYRVVGPFSVPDYGRGAYGALLALRILKRSFSEMTFSTAMHLRFDGIEAEADYVAWWRKDSMGDPRRPSLVIGEAKSFGEGELITSKDLAKLKLICAKLPGSTTVVSVLRDTFTTNEKQLLHGMAKWGRRPDPYGQATNPIILLTGRELFGDTWIGQTWKVLGPPYERFAENADLFDLREMADATQWIHLDLPPLASQRDAEWKSRAQRKAHKGASAADHE